MLRRGARVALVALLAGCAAAPYTRRSQLILISSEEENKLGARAFQQVLGKSHPDGRAQVNGPVEAVGQRLGRRQLQHPHSPMRAISMLPLDPATISVPPVGAAGPAGALRNAT